MLLLRRIFIKNLKQTRNKINIFNVAGFCLLTFWMLSVWLSGWLARLKDFTYETWTHILLNVNYCPTRYDYIQFYHISVDSSTCFGWYLHPSSGAHVNCNYSIWHWSNRNCYLLLLWRSRNGVPTTPRQRTVANMVWPMPDNVITVYVCSWWWVKVSPATCSAVCTEIW